MSKKIILIRLLRLGATLPIPIYFIALSVNPHSMTIALSTILYCALELACRGNDDTLARYLGMYARCVSVPAFVLLAVAHFMSQPMIGTMAEASVLFLLVPFVQNFLSRLTESIAEEFLWDSRP